MKSIQSNAFLWLSDLPSWFDCFKSRVWGQSIKSSNWGSINMSAAQHSLSSYDDVRGPALASAAVTAARAHWAGDRTRPVRGPDGKHESLLLELLFVPWCSAHTYKHWCTVSSTPGWTTHTHTHLNTLSFNLVSAGIWPISCWNLIQPAHHLWTCYASVSSVQWAWKGSGYPTNLIEML